MTIKKLVKEIQKIYNRKIDEILEKNAELKKEILALQRDVILYRTQRDNARVSISSFLSLPWWKRMFCTKL